MAEMNTGAEVTPNTTLYINNLNEQLKKSLYVVFSQFGKILDVLAFKTLTRKDQAWVVFDDVSSASNVLRQMQGFPFYDKPMEKGKEKREQHDANQAGMVSLNPAYGATPSLSKIPHPGDPKSMIPEAPAPPNNILFVQNLPHKTTPMMLQMLFNQFPSFKEVRMVEAKPGIAFVEFEDEMRSAVAMQGFQGFKITQLNPMLITYAKK